MDERAAQVPAIRYGGITWLRSGMISTVFLSRGSMSLRLSIPPPNIDTENPWPECTYQPNRRQAWLFDDIANHP